MIGMVKSSTRGLATDATSRRPSADAAIEVYCSRPGITRCDVRVSVSSAHSHGPAPTGSRAVYNTVRGSSGASDVTISRSVNASGALPRRPYSPDAHAVGVRGAVDEVDPLSIGRPHWRMIVEPFFAYGRSESDSHHRRSATVIGSPSALVM